MPKGCNGEEKVNTEVGERYRVTDGDWRIEVSLDCIIYIDEGISQQWSDMRAGGREEKGEEME